MWRTWAKPIERAALLTTIQRYANLTRSQAPAAPAVSPEVAALVPQYLASKPKQIAEAREWLAAREFTPIRRFGHNLKGTGSGYGFPAIEEMGEKLERAAAAADVDLMAEQLLALNRFVSETAVTQLAPASAAPTTDSTLPVRLQPLSLR